MAGMKLLRPAEGVVDGAALGAAAVIEELPRAVAVMQDAIRLAVRLSVFGEAALQPALEEGIDFFEEVKGFERRLIRMALQLTNGHQGKAAALLNLRPTTLNTKIKVYGIDGGRAPRK